MSSKIRKGVILYDFLQVPGGAELVFEELAHLFPEASSCVGFCTSQFDDQKLIAEGLRVLGQPITSRPLQYLVNIHRFKKQKKFIADSDWAIYSGSTAVCAVHNQSMGARIHYCHTPPRFVYDLKKFWEARVKYWQRPFFNALVWYVKREYELAISEMDLLIANSENVRQRIQNNLGRDSIVIYPPCKTNCFHWHGQKDYYLSLSRLEPYKRVDLVIEAFKQMPEKKLIITSGGSDEDWLRDLAGNSSNITFTGWVSKQQMIELVGDALATIYIPVDEDFGMSPVESMAAGKPVIGVDEGGVRETVEHLKTGVLVPRDPTISDLQQAVNILDKENALSMREACEKKSEEFSVDVFREKMRIVIDTQFRKN